MNESAKSFVNFTGTSRSDDDILPELRVYRHIQLASAIMLCVLSPITVASNALFLTAIYKDPLRCFRTPVTYFIVGLSVADLLTGLTVEPFFASYYFADFSDFRRKPSESYQLIHMVGRIISTIAISTSFFVVLALSTSQYIAVTHPHRFKKIISRNRVLGSLAFSFAYITIFSMLQFTKIDLNTYYKVDLIIHPTLISVVLVVVHVLLYTSFNRHLKLSSSLRSKTSLDQKSAEKRNSCRKKHHDRQFTVMTFYLTAILLVSASFHTIVLYVFLFKEPRSQVENINIHIALRISDLMLFVKVALDIFIYAWRLPTYRRALRCTLFPRPTRASSKSRRKTSDGGNSEIQECGKRWPWAESATLPLSSRNGTTKEGIMVIELL